MTLPPTARGTNAATVVSTGRVAGEVPCDAVP